MHCDHCVKHVNAINSIDGASAKVDLKTQTAEVSYDREINDDDLYRVIEKAGYHIQSMTHEL